jgi:glycosyltransferase involved in cell wall biosynthesis
VKPCFIANAAWVGGGGEIGLELLATGLAEADTVPRVLTPGRGPVGERFERRVIPPSITGAAQAVRRHAADTDLIHTFGVRGLLAAALARTGKPLILHALIDIPHDLDPLLGDISDLVICNSHATARRFSSAACVEVVYNGVPAAVPSSKPLGMTPGRRHVGVIGRPAWWKGHLDLLPAVRAIVSERDDVEVIFAGRPGGPVSDAVEQLAGESGGQVRALGWVPRIRNHLHEFDLIVVPSHVEGFGRVAAEALRAGVPVLARRTGGLPEVLDGLADAWLPDDPGQWKDKILFALESYPDPPERLKELGARFTVEAQVARTLELYGDLLARAPAAR